MATRIFIGHISSQVREKDVERFFRNYGHIREIMLKNGYGFVEFDDYRDAEDAIYELNGKDLCGDRVTIQHARGTARGGRGRGRGRGAFRNDRYGPPVHTDYRLRVENLSSRMSWQDLKDYMRRAGEVTFADAHSYRRNEGVVEFATYSDLKNALEKFDNAEINGRKVKLTEDRPKRRQGSRSRSRSRSRGRGRRNWSRSRSRSQSRSRSRSRGRSHSRSRSRSQNRSRSRSHSRSRSPKSRSPNPSRSRSRSPSPSNTPTKNTSAPTLNGDDMSD